MNVAVDRSLGAVVVVAAVRGSLAGAVLAAIPVLFLTGTYGSEVLLSALGAMLGAASLAIGDDVSAHMQGSAAQWGARFVGGFCAPALALCPHFSLLGVAPGITSEKLLAGIALVGAGLGLGQVFAGPPTDHGFRANGCARALLASLVSGGAFGVAAGLWTGSLELLFAMSVAAMVVSALVLGLLAIVSLSLDPVAVGVARWLEPDLGHMALLEPQAAYRQEIAEALRLHEEAKQGSDPSLRERALQHARAAHAADQAIEARGTPRTTTAQLLVEILLELERWDEIELLLDRFPLAAPIRAEIARRRGDVTGAIALASPGAQPLSGSEDLVQSAIVASYRAVLALAEADRGNDQAAREHLARAREIPITVERALEGLTVPSVEAALARKRA